MTTIIRPLDLDNLQLLSGGHKPPTGSEPPEVCLLEAVAWMAGEPWSDHPQCVCDVLGSFGRRLNDLLPDDLRQKLVPFIPEMLGTAGDGHAQARRWMAVDWSVRTAAPMWMDAAGKADFAARYRAMPPIVDRASFDAVYPQLAEISSACYEVRKEWREKVRQAARKAVTEALAEGKDPSAAADAAAAAAAVAVAAAAADAERYSARYWKIRDEVYKRVYADVKARIDAGYAPVRVQVQESAIDLFGRMIRVGNA